jgi:hypothetical protein
MWVDHRQHWHVLYHRMFDNGTTTLPYGQGSGADAGAEGGWSGGHAFSKDGISCACSRCASDCRACGSDVLPLQHLTVCASKRSIVLARKVLYQC